MSAPGTRHPHRVAAGALLAAGVLAGCVPGPSPSGTGSAAPSASPPSVTATAVPSASPSAPAPTPSASAAPSLALDPPGTADPRVVAVTVTPELEAGGDGRLVVAVRSLADTRIDELVLRWPTALADHVFLQPFTPTPDRIREGGPPLVQPWTKWVIGPGEEGEPDGTTSLGWGPLLPGATLSIPLVATRGAPGPAAFDLQILAGNAVLTGEDGLPAEIRVELP